MISPVSASCAVVDTQHDASLADQLYTRLLRRTRLASWGGKLDTLPEFDLGYLAGALQQADWLDRCIFEEVNGYALVRSALQVAGSSPEMEFAAALMVAEPEGQYWFWLHLKNAVPGTADGSLLARNMLNVFGEYGKTLDELLEYARR